jgi:hypothetical protein
LLSPRDSGHDDAPPFQVFDTADSVVGEQLEAAGMNACHEGERIPGLYIDNGGQHENDTEVRLSLADHLQQRKASRRRELANLGEAFRTQ